MTHSIDDDAAAESVPRAQALASAIQRGRVARDNAFLNNIIDAVADPILVKDSQLRFLLVNQALCKFAGVARERFIGRTDADLFPAEQAAVFNEMDRRVLATREPNINEESLAHADGSVRTIRTTKTCFTDENGQQVLVGIFTDLTLLRAAQSELEAANKRLHELAHVDRLTGLPNRMYFEETLGREIAASARHGHPFAVLFMDLNGFKDINDTHGHHVGDELIRQVGARLAQAARRSDFVARLGGDEFVVIARQTGERDAGLLAHRLAGIIDRPYALSTAQAAISVSVGVAVYPRDGTDSDELTRHADAAMYRAKRVTGRPVEFHDPAPGGRTTT